MEHTLKCNSLTCRRELGDRAVVTTCSHVFCFDCSSQSQLQQQDGQRPICPACKVHLTNPDDVVVANLNPTEDYKTSVLSGLNPNIIIECAGRALNFWAYQTAQEIIYQEYVAKNLTNKYASLNTQMDKIIHDANAEISNLRNKLSSMQADLDTVRRKNEELVAMFREKSRVQLQTQELYDKLKRRNLQSQVQDAAADAVDQTIQASVTANRFNDKTGNQNDRMLPPPSFPQSRSNGIQQPGGISIGVNAEPVLRRTNTADGTWPGFNSQRSSQPIQPSQTPSTHRQRFASGNAPTPQIGLTNTQIGTSEAPLSHQRRSPRYPLADFNGNNAGLSGLSGYGLSAGLKVSNPSGGGLNGLNRQRIPSRGFTVILMLLYPANKLAVAQRSTSSLSGYNNPAFGGATQQNIFSNGNSYY